MIADYRLAQENLPEAQSDLREERAREERARRWASEITEYARQWSDRRDRLDQGEAVTESEPKLPEQVPVCEIWSKERIQAECDRIVDSPTRRDRLETFAGFVGGQCYPLLKYGQRPGFVLQHAFNAEPAGAAHDAAVPLMKELSGPCLLRRWSPEARPSPKPALLHTLEGHSNAVRSVTLTPNGRLAISAGDDNTLRVWDLISGDCSLTIGEHGDLFRTVGVSLDARRAVSACASNTLRLWDLESGRCLRILGSHNHRVGSIGVSPDGRLAVAGGDLGYMSVWDLETGKCLRTFIEGSHSVLNISITKDGRLAVTGGTFGVICVWDLGSGECLQKLVGHKEYAWCVSITTGSRKWQMPAGA